MEHYSDHFCNSVCSSALSWWHLSLCICHLFQFFPLMTLVRQGFLAHTQLPQRTFRFDCSASQRGQDPLPEVPTQAEVKQRPEAGVNAGQSRRAYQSCLQGTFWRIPRWTTLGFLRAAPEGVHNECDVVWHPKEKEDHHHEQDDCDNSLLLGAFRFALQRYQHTGAADDQDGCRQQEAQYVVGQTWKQLWARVDVSTQCSPFCLIFPSL